jgi:hypothetical protein
MGIMMMDVNEERWKVIVQDEVVVYQVQQIDRHWRSSWTTTKCRTFEY